MSIVILGKTPCGTCGAPIMEGDDIVSFSPFVSNRRHPLNRFSDSAFHRSCFIKEPLAESAIRISEESMRSGAPGHRRCIVCREEIQDPDDYLGTGFLTDDRSEPAFEFNFLHIHKSHFAQWERAAEFRRTMEAFLSSHAWEGPQLDFGFAPAWLSTSQRSTGCP